MTADSGPGWASDFNASIIEEFRANGGRVGGPWSGTMIILVRHTGARSGIEGVTPLGDALWIEDGAPGQTVASAI